MIKAQFAFCGSIRFEVAHRDSREEMRKLRAVKFLANYCILGPVYPTFWELIISRNILDGFYGVDKHRRRRLGAPRMKTQSVNKIATFFSMFV